MRAKNFPKVIPQDEVSVAELHSRLVIMYSETLALNAGDSLLDVAEQIAIDAAISAGASAPLNEAVFEDMKAARRLLRRALIKFFKQELVRLSLRHVIAGQQCVPLELRTEFYNRIGYLYEEVRIAKGSRASMFLDVFPTLRSVHRSEEKCNII